MKNRGELFAGFLLARLVLLNIADQVIEPTPFEVWLRAGSCCWHKISASFSF